MCGCFARAFLMSGPLESRRDLQDLGSSCASHSLCAIVATFPGVLGRHSKEVTSQELVLPPTAHISQAAESHSTNCIDSYVFGEEVYHGPCVLSSPHCQYKMQVFDIHEVVNNITHQTYDGKNITLDAICFKPFGDVCAIESIAQYWQMDREAYETGLPSLSQCLAHWSVQCRCVLIPDWLPS
jgi:hypothetical protein